jgi:hypothetical protein
MAASIAFPHHAEARRARVAGAPFGLDAREVELADGEFAPRQSAALVAIERDELPGDRRQTVRQARGAHELRGVLGELRHKDRNLRLEGVGAQVSPRSSDERLLLLAPAGASGAGSAAST